MLMAFKVEYTFACGVELSDEDRSFIANEAIRQANELDVGEDETFVFCFDSNGKDWIVYVDIGRRRVTVMRRDEAEKAGLPTSRNDRSGV